ncbi:putative endonuclease [Desulfosporosinus acidiphilus SJ4]|uniref:Putative endonuclease n=1 Tax=Desulfosporosinus acidiphilus (strain DSM 22704 / JCM 16185 / SJ4) TaxID=646529 RepID=I4D5S3_DESAJ|nr:GIY-YIG nuclease family protein [Desulfosporosinus acidiphilus]AFM41147.1 putative endonuclease [Desulfosporosinus acidiphilus SJ4]
MNRLDQLKQLPQKPGVYIMFDSRGNIIYIGKAKNLKNRVSQYFRNSKNRAPKIVEMIRNIHSFEYIVTDTELDALIEECRLIKEKKPMYNRQMKNSAKYIYLTIPNEDFPKIVIKNKKEVDGAVYFGPFPSLKHVEKTVQYLNDLYPLRKCPSLRLEKSSNGCLFRELGSCLGVCTGQVSIEEYKAYVDKIQQLFNGNGKRALQELSGKINRAIDNLEYEKAAIYRDYYLGLRHVLGKQKLVLTARKNKNIIAFEPMDGFKLKLFLIKGNRLLARKIFDLMNMDRSELSLNVLQNIRDTFTPQTREDSLLTQNEIDEAQIIDSYLRRSPSNVLHFWIPSSYLSKDKFKLETKVVSLIDRIYSELI